VITVAVGLAALSFLVVRDLGERAKPSPEFESLAESPDASLRGTVAYYDITTQCVRIVAAAGQPSRDVVCLTPEETFNPDHDTYGPLLAWLPDGRLAVTMFWWGEDLPESSVLPGWQKVVDVATGVVDETPVAQLPVTLPPALPAPGPDGGVIEYESQGGHVEIVLTDAAGSRILLSTDGNPDYWVKVPPTWSPDGRWIVVENGASQILLITVDDPAVTRLLVGENAMSWLGWSGRTHLAVTGADFPAMG
jgi:hypothetical protein